MTSWDAMPLPELGLDLVKPSIRDRLPRWDPRLWGEVEFSEKPRPGKGLLKAGLAWGRERAKARKLQQESITPESDVVSDASFTGKEEDIEVGLTYFGKRFLSAPLGRWVSPDPLAVHAPGSADLNLYAYVHGQVLRAIDPLGLDWTNGTQGAGGNDDAGKGQPAPQADPERVKADNKALVCAGAEGEGPGRSLPAPAQSEAELPGNVAAEGATSIGGPAMPDKPRQAPRSPTTDSFVGGARGVPGTTSPIRTGGETIELSKAARVAAELYALGVMGREILAGLEGVEALEGAAAARAGAAKFGSGKAPHVAEVTVIRDGEVVSQQSLTSGGMTPEEAALGFPRSSLATHTEARAARSTPLKTGDSMTIQGQYPPCPSCKGAMNKAAGESGASIQYKWDGKTWTAGGGRK